MTSAPIWLVSIALGIILCHQPIAPGEDAPRIENIIERLEQREYVLDRYSGYLVDPSSVVRSSTAWYERIVLFAIGTLSAVMA